MLRDFLLFVAALWREWKVLLTGGSIIALTALWGFAKQKPLPQNVNWLIVGLTLILASFFAWRRQWIEADQNVISIEPSKLTRLVWDRTEVHAKTLIAPYLGKRIKVTGPIKNVSNLWPWGGGLVRVESGKVSVYLRLSFWGVKPFIPLPLGTLVTVSGRISHIDHFGVSIVSVALLPNPETPLETPLATDT